VLEGESWNDLLGALFHSSQAPDAGQRETAFRIFATTPGIIERQHEEVVLTAFTRGFKDPDTNVDGYIMVVIRVADGIRSALLQSRHSRPSSDR
jgi:hypothetical protein